MLFPLCRLIHGLEFDSSADFIETAYSRAAETLGFGHPRPARVSRLMIEVKHREHHPISKLIGRQLEHFASYKAREMKLDRVMH